MKDDLLMSDDGFDSLPVDDYFADEETPVEALETEQVEEHTSEPNEPVQAEQEPQTTPQTIKIKYDREERELSVEEAAELAQKGMNYERAVERARQEAAQAARDAVIAEMGYTWNGKAVTTEAEYKAALAEQKAQEEIQKLAEREGIPEEFAKQMYDLQKWKRDSEEAAKKAKEESEAKARNEANLNDFLNYFKEVNDRAFDPQKDVIPQEVREAIERGETPKNAYMAYHNKELMKQLKIARQNEENQKRAPVAAVSAHGGVKNNAEDDWFSKGEDPY